MRFIAFAVCCACGVAPMTGQVDASTSLDDAGVFDGGPPETWPLGLNDVSFLLPLDSPPTSPRFGPTSALLPAAEFATLVTNPADTFFTMADFHVVAVRFDVCDRTQPGPCTDDTDGVVRLVLQPVADVGGPLPANGAADTALHAFYPVPKAELPGVVTTLRRLARTAGTPASTPLGVSGVTADGRWPEFRALVLRSAAASRLTRLTFFAQPQMFAQVRWVFRGREKVAGAFRDMTIGAGAADLRQEVFLGLNAWSVIPATDTPVGLALAISANDYARAGGVDRTAALDALAAIDNPMLHAPETVTCAACHVATLARAARDAGIDPPLPNSFVSTWPLGLTHAPNDRSMRIFGYLHREPHIAQRVVNDSAQVLHDITARFPR